MEGEPAALYDIPNGYVLAEIYFSKVPYEITFFPVRIILFPPPVELKTPVRMGGTVYIGLSR